MNPPKPKEKPNPTPTEAKAQREAKAKAQREAAAKVQREAAAKTQREEREAAEAAAKAQREAEDDFSEAIATFKGQLLVRMQRQQKRLVLTGNSKDDCQKKQQSAVHVEEATMYVIEIAQKMYEKIDCSRKHRGVVVKNPLVKHLAEAVCNLAEQRHTLGFYELRGACKQLGHHRKKSGSCVLASSARPQRSDNPSAQTGRAPHKAKEHIQKLKKWQKTIYVSTL